ncbi:MerR family transcriptional regulator [Sphingomonas sp. CGMCC 1.13654]|uniref:MerR family transcriptional regulator n=1 Tax=Sphingomonas chungangi TaxID=2683589 RepID=A0A838L7H7_9SPHN|nr:MerR family transcriptional regulator [Sphingomonas chungangi]
MLPINEVAQRFRIKASALRYYEEIGLLRPMLRRSGRRYYGLTDLRRLSLIQLLQDTARMSLSEITEIVRDAPDDRDVRTIIEDRIAILEEQIEAARSAERYLKHRLTCPRDNPIDECPILAGELTERLEAAGIGSS